METHVNLFRFLLKKLLIDMKHLRHYNENVSKDICQELQDICLELQDDKFNVLITNPAKDSLLNLPTSTKGSVGIYNWDLRKYVYVKKAVLISIDNKDTFSLNKCREVILRMMDYMTGLGFAYNIWTFMEEEFEPERSDGFLITFNTTEEIHTIDIPGCYEIKIYFFIP